MARVSIDIPDDLRAKMEARAAAMGHATLERYIEWLVRSDADPVDLGAPDRLKVRSRQHLETLLQDALESPAREMGAADWDEMRRRLIDQHRRSKAG